MPLSSRIENIALEIFSVVLGVLLALGANAWHVQRTHDADARQALVSIQAELQANRAALQARVSYHKAMRDSLVALVARTHTREVPGGQLAIANWNGIQPSRLLDDAWQTAHAIQAIQYVPYDVAIGLSRTYAIQSRIGEINRAFFAAVYTPAFASGGVTALGAMSSYLADLSATEDQLIKQYDDEITRLGRQLGTSG